jgi:hypothetical protein
MGEIEKVGDLESRNLNIKNYLRNTGIEECHIGLVKISPFRMEKFEINEPIQNEPFSNEPFSRYLILISLKQKMSFKHCLTPKNLI